MHFFLILLQLVLAGLVATRTRSIDVSSTCSASSPCTEGCCNKNGFCGFGPEYCASGVCISSCNATAECGQYAPSGQSLCPLNVCCSQYGFCGTTSDFCGTGCQNGCGAVTAPSCGGTSSSQRYIGYYESWSPGLACDNVTPDQINPTPWTHLYYAFALIGSDNTITQMNSYDLEFYTTFNALKQKNPSLKTFISVGGWAAGGAVFSNMVMHTFTRSAFINSAIALMEKYGFDGIDIDWEYPAAPDRDGVPEDTENYVAFLQELKQACGSTYGLTATLPSSYWYMQGFDIVGMSAYVDWFNFMSYDIHGTWDGDSPYTQAVVQPATNLTEIAEGLDLLWRNNIDPAKVALGLAFYGRSFTLADPSCKDVGCPFSSGGTPGDCTATSGILSDYEMSDILADESPSVTYNAEAAINWMTWDNNQWVSYDDGRTLAQKASFADSLCLSGLFAWAVDLGGPGLTGNPHSLSNGTGLGGDAPGVGGTVLIAPQIYTQSNPTIACEPPCTFVFPPKTLSTTTTISFPPYSTSLEVAWSTTAAVSQPGGSISNIPTVTRIIVYTTLSIPPVTTTEIQVSNWIISNSMQTSTPYTLSSSILPPPFTITDNPDPLSQSGVTHPIVIRTITPPPYPFAPPGPPPSSKGPALPVVTFKPGTPGPICQTGCGHPCFLFCGTPCFLNCGTGDFPDPLDPNPPGCSGPDCINGFCKGPLCVEGGCTGLDCIGGLCNGPDCTYGGCSGPDCIEGSCTGSDCCYGPDCVSGSCAGSSCVQGSDGGDDENCTTKEKAPICTVTISSSQPAGASTYSTTTSKSCRTVTACTVTGTTVTTTLKATDPSCPIGTIEPGNPFSFGPFGPTGQATITPTLPIVFPGSSTTTTKSTKTTSKPTPTPTPVGSDPGNFALNVYSDKACKTLVAGYREQDLSISNCMKLPSPAQSYQFVSESSDCEAINKGFTIAAFWAISNCTGVDGGGGGCGNIKTCQLTMNAQGTSPAPVEYINAESVTT